MKLRTARFDVSPTSAGLLFRARFSFPAWFLVGAGWLIGATVLLVACWSKPAFALWMLLILSSVIASVIAFIHGERRLMAPLVRRVRHTLYAGRAPQGGYRDEAALPQLEVDGRRYPPAEVRRVVVRQIVAPKGPTWSSVLVLTVHQAIYVERWADDEHGARQVAERIRDALGLPAGPLEVPGRGRGIELGGRALLLFLLTVGVGIALPGKLLLFRDADPLPSLLKSAAESALAIGPCYALQVIQIVLTGRAEARRFAREEYGIDPLT